jgi:hypothetical protein
MHTTPQPLAWVVSADMGYGHQRAAHPLRSIAHQGIIAVGRDDASSPSERGLWSRLLGVYETFSRARGMPVIGKPIFNILDSLLHIPSLYPIRDLSRSTFQVDLLASLVRQGLGRGLLARIGDTHLPLVTSYFAPAVAADMAGYDRIYCIICDADLNRVWVAKQPWESRINYFAPCGRAAQRLRAYGVPEERIFLTGFPLPQELLGDELATLKQDLSRRLVRLDPERKFQTLHAPSVKHFLGVDLRDMTADGPLTITYAVGGAGAQKEIGGKIAASLRGRLERGEVRLNLVAGVREEVRDYFLDVVRRLPSAAASVSVHYAATIPDYFETFNALLHTTDILWTKPSELSFYCALGIPVVMTPTIGSQEKFNRRWLFEVQAGMRQENPDYTDHWLRDAVRDGRMAEMAWDGFLKARKLGTQRIIEVLTTGRHQRADSPLER